MQFNLQKLNEVIKSSNLKPAEQEEFLFLFSKISDKKLDAVINVLKDDPNWINKLYKNYETKKKALKQKDKSAWQEILQDEYDTLIKIESLDY